MWDELSGLREGDRVAEGLELFEQIVLSAVVIVRGDEVGAELAVRLLVLDHGVDGDEHGVSDGDEGTFVAASLFESPELGLEVGSIGIDG